MVRVKGKGACFDRVMPYAASNRQCQSILYFSNSDHLAGRVKPKFLAITLGSPLWPLGVGMKAHPQEYGANELPRMDG